MQFESKILKQDTDILIKSLYDIDNMRSEENMVEELTAMLENYKDNGKLQLLIKDTISILTNNAYYEGILAGAQLYRALNQ